MNSKFITPEQAVALIPDESTIYFVGMTLSGAAESILKEIEKRFLTTGKPNSITYMHACGQSDRIDGSNHLAHEGLVTKIIGSHWGLAPRWMDMIDQNKLVAYCLPQGQMTHLVRAMSCGSPGILSKIGLGTFIDPRIEGGKMNAKTKTLPDLTEVITLHGEEYIYYKEIPIDVTIIRGTTADTMGNLTIEEEAMKLEMLPAVLAARRFGGKVIAQVKRVAELGTLHPKEVVVPGVFIDAIVVCDNPDVDHRQTSSWVFDPAYSGDLREPETLITPLPMDIRKIIGRRGALELTRGDVINLGTGIPNDVISGIVAEEGFSKDVVITVESGIYGGLSAGGIDFGIGKNLLAMIEHDKQFDYYNGIGVDITFMGAGQMDKHGNVNSTKLGPKPTGAGGFIDITSTAKHVVFLSQFTASGLEVSFDNKKVSIKSEGKVKKLVDQVSQISYNGEIARAKGQKMHYVTERAVFELRAEGPVLIEIAPGIDLQKDILNQMEFAPLISEDLKEIPSFIYSECKMGSQVFQGFSC